MTSLQRSSAEVLAETLVSATGGRRDTVEFITERLCSGTLVGMMRLLVALHDLLEVAQDIAMGPDEETGDKENEQ